MKTEIRDYRNEDRTRNVVRDLDGNPYVNPRYHAHSDVETDLVGTADRREVSITLEPEDYAEFGIPETLKGRSKGKHDGTFFVRNITFIFNRSYKNDAVEGEEEKSRFGPTGSIVVSGPSKLKSGAASEANSLSSGFPTHHREDDLTKPYTLERFNSGELSYSNRGSKMLTFDSVEDLEAHVIAELKASGRGVDGYHRFGAELRGIKTGKFEEKSVADPLPDFLAKIRDLVHPESSKLPFAHSNEHRFAEFAVGKHGAAVSA